MARVLIVDDEQKLRTMIRNMLESAGHATFEAENGRAAMDVAREHRPDLLITDIIMPDKNGVETIIDMKKELPEIRIVAISGGGRTKNLDFLKLARKAGANATLPKPFRLAELIDAVDTALKAD